MKLQGRAIKRPLDLYGSLLSKRKLHHKGKPRLKELCSVYVVGPENGHPVKIGKAKNAEARLSSLQTSRPDKLYVWEVVWLRNSDDALKVERHCHQFLKSINKALRGEWFDIRAEEAVRVIDASVKVLGLRVPGGDDWALSDNPEDALTHFDMQLGLREFADAITDRANRHIKKLAKLGKIG